MFFVCIEITYRLYHIDVIRMSDGLIADSNIPSKNRHAASEAYELQAAVHATTVPHRQTMVPRYFANGNRCIMNACGISKIKNAR